ncbi:MAG: TolC family protein [Williamsia sp.]|nr:TolC family protein [Williamsia sp.]
MIRPFIMCLLLSGLLSKPLFAQPPGDSLRISLPQAEQRFLEKNLALVAQQYNIQVSQALTLQNRYFDNPSINTDQNVYDGKFFRHNADYGQVYVQLQQLIKTAGKRNKLVRLSQDATLSSQQQFQDVLRNLRYLLQTNFFALHQSFQTNALYQNEYTLLQALSTGMDAQLKAGNISQRENIRIKSLLFNLEAEQADLQRQITDTEKDLRTLLHVGSDTTIVPELPDLSGVGNNEGAFTLPQLLDTARLNRPDVQLAQTNLLTQQHNLAYQKALAVPDLTAGVEYDKRNSYTSNYYGLTLGLPLPLFNKNKGNIKAAELNIQLARNGIDQVQNQVDAEVSAAWQKLQTAINLQKLITPEFTAKYNELLQNITRSFQQRQVGLVEFIDFFEAYRDARLKQFQQENNLRSAYTEINFTTGSNIINLQ